MVDVWTPILAKVGDEIVRRDEERIKDPDVGTQSFKK